MKSILIIGASSLVGKSLISRLGKNFKVFGTYNKNKINNKKFIYLNLKKKNLFKILSKFKNIHTVIWCVQNNNINSGYKEFNEINIFGLIKIMEFVKKIKIKKFVFFSSGSIYKSSRKKLSENSKLEINNSYSLTKSLGEKICEIYSKDYNFDLIILRPFTIYGKNQKSRLIFNLISKIKKESKIFVDGKNGIKLSCIHVNDIPPIIKYLINNYKNKYSIINLSSPYSYTIREFCDLISKKFDKKTKIISNSKIKNLNYVNKNNFLSKKFKFLTFNNFLRENF